MEAKTNIILIDFENVQPSNLALLRGRPYQTKVFVGAHQTKIPFEMAMELQALGPNAEYIRMQGSGPNALDFHIAFYIGRLSAEFPAACFHIVSRDTGFDPLVRHLKARNISCQRFASLNEIPGLSAAPPERLPEQVARVADTLARLGVSRPRRVKTLMASVRSLLGGHATEHQVTQVLAQLEQRRLVVVSDGKVTYPDPEVSSDPF